MTYSRAELLHAAISVLEETVDRHSFSVAMTRLAKMHEVYPAINLRLMLYFASWRIPGAWKNKMRGELDAVDVNFHLPPELWWWKGPTQQDRKYTGFEQLLIDPCKQKKVRNFWGFTLPSTGSWVGSMILCKSRVPIAKRMRLLNVKYCLLFVTRCECRH